MRIYCNKKLSRVYLFSDDAATERLRVEGKKKKKQTTLGNEMFISYFTPKNSSLVRFKIEIQCRNLKNQYFVKCLLLRVTF